MQLSLIFAHVTLEVTGRGTAWTSAVASAQVFLSLQQPPDGTCDHLRQSGGSSAQSPPQLCLSQGDRPSSQGPTQPAFAHSVSTAWTFSRFLQHARWSVLQGLCTGCFFCQDYSFYMVPSFLEAPAPALCQRSFLAILLLKTHSPHLLSSSCFLFSVFVVSCCCFISRPLEGLLHGLVCLYYG